jgi:hypothetical protein
MYTQIIMIYYGYIAEKKVENRSLPVARRSGDTQLILIVKPANAGKAYRRLSIESVRATQSDSDPFLSRQCPGYYSEFSFPIIWWLKLQ